MVWIAGRYIFVAPGLWVLIQWLEDDFDTSHTVIAARGKGCSDNTGCADAVKLGAGAIARCIFRCLGIVMFNTSNPEQ